MNVTHVDWGQKYHPNCSHHIEHLFPTPEMAAPDGASENLERIKRKVNLRASKDGKTGKEKGEKSKGQTNELKRTEGTKKERKSCVCCCCCRFCSRFVAQVSKRKTRRRRRRRRAEIATEKLAKVRQDSRKGCEKSRLNHLSPSGRKNEEV